MTGDSAAPPLSDAEIRNLEATAGQLRRARDDADAALLAVETLLGLARRRLPAASVTPIEEARCR